MKFSVKQEVLHYSILLGPGNGPAKLPKRLSGVSQSTQKILSPKNTSFFPVNFTGTHYLPKSVFGSGARFSKDPVTTGPVNLPGRLTGNFTWPGIAFLEAPVNFPDTYRAR